MLKHHYQSWYGENFHLTGTQWNAVLVLVLGLAALSALRPKLVSQLLMSFLQKLLSLLRIKKAGPGIEVAGEWLSDEARLRHTQISGATGTGKTLLMEQIIYGDIARGHGAMIIDPKGDREFYDRLKKFCKSIGREKDLHFLSASWPDESVRWNPCRLGNSSELQSKWFRSGVYREPFYATACELALLEAFNALLIGESDGFTLSDLVRQLEVQSKASKNQNVEGLYNELKNFAFGEWGPILCAAPALRGQQANREVTLLEITQKNEILFVDLPTESKAIQSARVGKLLLQEIMLISGLRKHYSELKSKSPFSIFVDEFDAFATENFVTFQNKGRSSEFMIHIAHQTLSDLDRISPTFKGQIMGNCNVRYIFRQDFPDDAEMWSRFLGTKSVVKKTFQTKDGFWTGSSSNRETQEFVIHPDRIKNMGTGQCIFSVKTDSILKELKIPFPLKLPKRKAGRLLRGETKASPAPDFNQATSELGGILEEARKSKTVIGKRGNNGYN